MIRTNLKGVLFAVQSAVPLMSSGGSIILIGSTASVAPPPGMSIYGAIKAGFHGMVRAGEPRRAWRLGELAKHVGMFAFRGAHPHAPALRRHGGDGIDGVHQQVQEDLLQMNAIAHDGSHTIRQLHLQLDLTRPRIRPDDGNRFLCYLIEVNGMRLQFVLLKQPAHPSNHLTRPDVVLPDVADDAGHFTECWRHGVDGQQRSQVEIPRKRMMLPAGSALSAMPQRRS